jgi:DHA2 family multidrug resistance protein-like MFS transporter
MDTTTPTGKRAGRREWAGLAALALPTLLLSLDLSVLYLALPHLAADLRPSSSQLLWIMDIYGFMVAGFLITMGTLGDRIGRRRLLLIGAGAFGVASVLAAYSTSAEMLIVTRVLLGVAGATLMPSTLGLISNMFPDARQRGTAIAVWISCFMGGTAIGPVVGGTLLQWFWWGSAFLLGVPVMALLLIVGPALLPESRDEQAGRLDLVSVALSLTTILPIIYGIKEVARDGLTTGSVLAIMAGAAVGVVFVRRQNRLASPLLDLRLFGNRTFTTALGVMLIATVTMGGVFLFVSQYLQLVRGFTPLVAGLWLVPPTLGMIASTMLTPRLAQRVGRGNVIGGGIALSAVGMALLTQVDPGGGLWLVVVGLAICSIGLGPCGALVTDIVVGAVPPERAGSAASMSETSGELGIATGIAVLGSLGTAVYRSQVTLPADTPAELGAATRDTLASAVAAAEQLPAGVAAGVLESAREAFTSGLNVVAGVGMVALAIFAVAAVALLRETGSGDQAPAADPAGRGDADELVGARDHG